MSESVLLKCKGLYSFPNHLSEVPSGALLKAKNIVINRDSVAESRRGFKLYGNSSGGSVIDISHQLISYKGRLLRHWGIAAGTTLEYDSDGLGLFEPFILTLTGTTHSNTTIDGLPSTSQLHSGMTISGSGIPASTSIVSISDNSTIIISNSATTSITTSLTFMTPVSEVNQGLRIKSIEQNGNLYFTTSSGIKKLSAADAGGLPSTLITKAGGIKALDFTATIAAGPGFLTSSNNVGTSGTVISGSLTGTITNNTATSPTVITSVNHKLFTGDIITITGSNSTPTINGTFPVTILDNNTFSIPVNVTTLGTAGSWTYSAGHANIIYGIPDTSVLTIGYSIVGTGIPTNTTITEIIDSNTIKISNNVTTSGSITLSSATNAVVAYRIVWGITDINKNEILGSPSARGIIRNTDVSNSKNVSLTITIPKGITTAYFYQVYRTPVINDPFNNQDPGDEEQLVLEGNPLQTDLTNGFITVLDNTPETFRAGGANLYTNQNSGEGILQSNDLPPLAKDITSFKGYTFFSNTQTLQRLNISLLSVTKLVADVSSITINNGATSNTYTFSNSEDIPNKKVLISTQPTPAQEVDESARSLVRVINRQANESVYAYYLSGPSDVPGLILLEARDLNQPAFYVTCDDNTTTGLEFTPNLPTSGMTVISDNEVQPNRIYYSKFQQPDAVPIVNFIDVGPRDKEIIRVLALRDNLFILKEDGVYRLSGQTSEQFTIYPFDFSVTIKAPDSAVVLNNLIYLYSSQGISTISDTGVAVISRPIEDSIAKFVIPAYANFKTATFGVSYESDRTYYLFTVTSINDVYATQCLRYNTFTQTWTQSDLAKRCGIVNSSDDQLYLGATDTNFIEQERKSFDRTDFSDRQVGGSLSSNSINNLNIILPSVNNISAGDVLVQTQYLTINKFNQILTKLDRDSKLTARNYSVTLKQSAGTDLSAAVDSLILKISIDAGRTSTPGSTSAITYTNLSPTGPSFINQQTNYNLLIDLLNSDIGVGYKNYVHSVGTVSYEFIIMSVDVPKNTITSPFIYPLIQGPYLIYNHINVELAWTPQFFQDVSMTKHVSEGTLIFEDSDFSTAILSYASDLSANFEDTTINGQGNGIFGNFSYGNGLYGGSGSGVPFRTYLPKEKQRARYINVKFSHAVARESFALYGLSLTYNPTSQRGWR